jgi:FkbM family methyltransferase
MSIIELKKKVQRFFLYPVLGKTYLQWLYKPMRVIATKGMNFGGGSVFEKSGELHLLKELKRKADADGSGSPFVLFDVGANIGDYSLAAAGVFAPAKHPVSIYAFEPSPTIYAELKKNTTATSTIQAYNFGLSGKDGSGTLFFNKDHSVTSSLHKGNLVNFGLSVDAEEPITLKTLDTFCLEQNIQTINFLKLDVEGHELEVLKGARGMFSRRAILALQFEIGRTNIDSRTFFRDYFDLLHNDFTIYRLLKNGLSEIKEYNELDEVFMTTNYFAVLK